MDSFEAVIGAFGGPAKFAAAIGIEPFHAQSMKNRGSIPPAYWQRVVTAASDRLGENPDLANITYEVLSHMAERRARRRETDAA